MMTMKSNIVLMSGYVVYPGAMAVNTLREANKIAREESISRGETRVENCSTERTVSRFVYGVKVPTIDQSGRTW